MEDLHIISIDIGTSAARIILFDLDANPVRIVNHPYSLISRKPNWSEQDPDEIVNGVVSGLRDIDRLAERVPTFAFTLKGFTPRQVAEELGKRDIYVWDGNYYALSVTESLGVEESGGMVRVGPGHYNTVEEIERFGEALGEIAISKDN